ncbi:hypothetical protein PV327_010725 [Microctonus hyperodae]|uniref:Uncharacterized protein n=1 Tax=Microctonus hyperodae TaxID=165561 RepID=A0AA39F0C8_MICHY|nr:hypothetical protein PV327_010725 [Microctonus hyperodae]
MMFNMTKILIFMGIIGIIKISLIVSIKGLSYDNPKPNNDTRLIVCIVDYDNFVQLSGSWGYEKDYTDNSSVYSLFDYTDHANSFTEFINKYPTVTISTSGKAISESTFGDVGRNKFGKLNYPTTNFAVKDHVHHVDIVNSYLSKLLTYYIRVNIGIGFKREDGIYAESLILHSSTPARIIGGLY